MEGVICQSRSQQIAQAGKYTAHYSEKTAYYTEPEIGNSTYKSTGENR